MPDTLSHPAQRAPQSERHDERRKRLGGKQDDAQRRPAGPNQQSNAGGRPKRPVEVRVKRNAQRQSDREAERLALAANDEDSNQHAA